MIGHGGDETNATLAGDIGVLAGGNLTVTGGSYADGFGMIGHGSARATTSGTRNGAVKIGVSRATTLIDNAGGVRLGHGTSTVAGVSNSEFVLATGTLDSAANAFGVSGTADVMGEGGDVSFAVFGGDLTIDGAGAFNNSAYHSNFVAAGAINALASIQNGGAGQVNLAAGWNSLVGINPLTNEFDGSNGLTLDIDFNNCLKLVTLEFNFSPVAGDPTLWGTTGSSIMIGSDTQSVGIGSAGGTTNIFGEGISVKGGDTNAGSYAQIGYFGTGGDMTGDINLLGIGGGLSVEGGNAAGSFAQVGHGGFGAVGSDVIDSDITVLFSQVANAVTVAAGEGDSTYAQIGHGGIDFNGALSGDVIVGDRDPLLSNVSDVGVTGGGSAAGTEINAYAQIGNGGYSSMGAKSGEVSLNATSVLVAAGTGVSSSARIGNGGSRGSGDIDGDVAVFASTGSITVAGGDGTFADAMIGSGGIQYAADSITSATTVTSPLDVILSGGAGIQASAQIGAGGLESTADVITGNVAVTAGNDIRLTGGTDIRGFSQIGNGGATADGDFSGMIDVISGNDIFLTTANGDTGAYAKIGHGDDLFSLSSTIGALAGSGTRDGGIKVSAASDIVMLNGMIGHVNHAATSATATGSTQIAVSTAASTDPAGGSLVADSDSEFAGSDELRFYLSERSSNDVQAGAFFNGVAFEGAETDPSELQRDDEFTVFITGDQTVMPDEHGNTFDTGAAPSNAGSFAFYYNSIELVTVPDIVIPGTHPVGGGGSGSGDSGGGSGQGGSGGVFGGFSLFQFLGMFPSDKAQSDWIRENEGLYTGFNTFGMFFEGYDQYDVNGNPVVHFDLSNDFD